MIEDVLKNINVETLEKEEADYLSYYIINSFKLEDIKAWISFIKENNIIPPYNYSVYEKEIEESISKYIDFVSNKQFIRYAVKDINKKVKTKYSSNMIKKFVAGFFIDILNNASLEAYHNYFNNDDIEDLMDCIDQNLYDEFISIMVYDLSLAGNGDISKLDQDYVDFFAMISIGKYFVKYKRGMDDLENTKKDIQVFFNSTKEEMQAMRDAQSERDYNRVIECIDGLAELSYDDFDLDMYVKEIRDTLMNKIKEQ